MNAKQQLSDCALFVGVLAAYLDSGTRYIPYVIVAPPPTPTPGLYFGDGLDVLHAVVEHGMHHVKANPFEVIATQPPGWRATAGPTEGLIVAPDGVVLASSINTAVPGWSDAVSGFHNSIVTFFVASRQFGDGREDAYVELRRCAPIGRVAGGVVPCTWQSTNPQPAQGRW